jgi:hypothetical protein
MNDLDDIARQLEASPTFRRIAQLEVAVGADVDFALARASSEVVSMLDDGRLSARDPESYAWILTLLAVALESVAATPPTTN